MEKNKKSKIFLKDYLLLNEIVDSEETALREILCGNVISSNKKFSSTMELVSKNDHIYLKKNSKKYVSRGGEKIESVFNDFDITVKDKLCIDCGSSTGGFTDFLLQQGAKDVIALDVGYGILAHKLLIDPKVIQIERTNIRNLNFKSLSELIKNHPKNINGHVVLPADMITADLSFISLKTILPVLKGLLTNSADLLLLFKPQFELAKNDVPEGGIVNDSAIIKHALQEFINFSINIGFKYINHTQSKLKGTKGNQEIFIHLKSS